MPVFGVWIDDALYFTSGETSRKAKNLVRSPHCVITASVPTLDLIVEGEAMKVTNEAKLHRVVDAYASKYGWRLTVRDGTLFADFGAPSAGPPPYDAYELTPSMAFGFGIVEPFGATRWRFRERHHAEVSAGRSG